MAYSVLLAPSAERQLKTLADPIQKRIVKRLRALQTYPRPAGVTKLVGEDDLYRIREGNYRIIYTIRDKDLIVLVVKIGNRKEVYK
ncbi:MAG: type II toxin-antitoxin system RelE/ParE family toxin [Nitrospiraceae bacterium]